MILGFLSLDFTVFKKELSQPLSLILTLVGMKFVLPGMLFFLSRLINTELAIAVLLVSAAPFATVSPAITKLCKGNSEYSLVLLVITTLMAPFTLPGTVLLFTGVSMEIDIFGMMISLLQLIITPFLISLVLKRFIPRLIVKQKSYFGSYSVILVFILLLGLIAHGADDIRVNIQTVPFLGIMAFALGGIQGIIAWIIPLGRKKRIALSVGSIYVNVGLVIVLAAAYFSLEVMIFCVLYELPANLLPGLLRRLTEGKSPAEPEETLQG